MNKIKEIIFKKSQFLVIVSLIYLVVVGFLKWKVHPPIGALWFIAGGVLGIYFLDFAEAFFALQPSPFRTIVFEALFVIVGFFVISSSGSYLASGLVLTMLLTMLIWQISQWQITKNLQSWYRMIAIDVSVSTQRTILIVIITLFLLQTYLFVR